MYVYIHTIHIDTSSEYTHAVSQHICNFILHTCMYTYTYVLDLRYRHCSRYVLEGFSENVVRKLEKLLHACMRVCTYAIHTCASACMCFGTNICLYVCIYICVCTYMYKHMHVQTYIHAYTHTYKLRYTQTHTHACIHTYIHTSSVSTST